MTDENYQQYKTFWRRTFAIFLDGVAIAPIFWIDQILWNGNPSNITLLIWEPISTALLTFYSVGFVYLLGQTPGKIATGVIILSNDGNKLSLKQAILREIVPIIIAFITLFIAEINLFNGQLLNRGLGHSHLLMWFGATVLIWVFLELVTMLTNSKRRAIHDFIAGTIVIKQAPENRRAGYRKILWFLLLLYVADLFIKPYLPAETNIVNPRKTLVR